jgi:hypothetical protein
MERTLAQLADVDRRYDYERSMVDGALHPQCWKSWRLEQLQKRHGEERQPLIHLLCSLYQQLAARTIAYTWAPESDVDHADKPDGLTVVPS